MEGNFNKAIALTFDDGPNEETTPLILDKLKKYGAKGTFFLMGDEINPASARVAKRAFDMGCELANHSRTHTAFTELTAEEMQSELDYTSDKIVEICGVKPKYFRPPYIAVNEEMFRIIDYPMVCGYGCDDWDPNVTVKQRADRILSSAADGRIILLHDSRGNIRTVEALDIIITNLFSRGYLFLTLSELFERHGITPQRGILYSSVLQTIRN